MIQYFKPFQNLMIDESLVVFRERLAYIQYIPSKCHHFGIKFFLICDYKTGYVLDFVMCSTSGVDNQLKFSDSVVKTLMSKHLGKGHILYTNSFYTSPALCQFLLEQKTQTCGTVCANWCHWPPFPDNTKKGDLQRKKCGKMLAIHWHDKRKFNLLSTVHTGELS